MTESVEAKTSWKASYKKYGLFISPMVFGAGFVLDLFTLNRIDQTFDLAILLIHTLLVTLWICLWHLHQSRKSKFQKRKSLKNWIKKYAPGAMQFSFGALFSGFVIFYTKSASLFICWPFLIILYLLFIGNESFRKFYKGLFFQTGVYYFSILTLMIFLVPLWLKRIGPDVFIVSGIFSLVIIGFIIRLMVYYFGSVDIKNHRRLWLWIFMIYMGVNVAYYGNLIPAIPLSLKTDGIYYFVQKQDHNYLALAQEKDFWEQWLPPNTIAKNEGEPVYYFSAVFAPEAFEEDIVHDWQQYDEKTEQWVSIFRQPLGIIGGRGGGYRGYTYLHNPDYGKWRVLVTTPRGQAIGQKNFTILKPTPEEPINLKKTVL